MTDSAIDQAVYNSDADNKWESSDVRTWLNSELGVWGKAFSDSEKKAIKETYKESETEVTSMEAPPLIRERVFLLSGQEIDDSKYGFFHVGSMHR